MDLPVLGGWIVDGASRALALEGGGESLAVWLEEDRGAIDLRAIDAEALQSLAEAVPGVEQGLVSWSRGDGQVERTMRELFRLRLMCDPARWLPVFEALSHRVEDNPEQSGSVLVATPVRRLLELLGLPAGLFSDAVRMMFYDNGFPLGDPVVAHLVSEAEPRVEDQGALLAALFDADGAVSIVQIVIDIHDWLSVVRPELTIGDSFPVVWWQTYEAAGEAPDAPAPETVDLTDALAALTPATEEIEAMLSDIEDGTAGGDGLELVASTVRVDPQMRSDLRRQSGAMAFVVRNAEPAEAVPNALAAMSSALWTIQHPDEPGTPLPSFVSDPVLIDGGGWFWADISDMEEEGAVIDQIVTVAVAAASRVLDAGELSAKRPQAAD